VDNFPRGTVSGSSKYKIVEMETVRCQRKSVTHNRKIWMKLLEIIQKKCTDRKQPRGFFFLFSFCFCGGLITILIAASKTPFTFCNDIANKFGFKHNIVKTSNIKVSIYKTDEKYLAYQI